ncbi:MAG: bifunctional riboflavin kinase/FAD synthetase [Actinobacteria bacterium]|nr:bifunctional riboflavin kinase/FAD synthetase [Actinomycetota bacterium]
MSKLIKLEKLKSGLIKDAVVVIGFFDGVHIGHKKIICLCVDRARETKGTSVVFTFDKPPLNILKKSMHKKLITSYADKIKLIKELGVDLIVTAKFDSNFSRIEPEEFCSKILIDKFNIQELFIGEDFKFGNRASGDTNFLKNFFRSSDVKVNIVPILRIGGIPVTSTTIRKFYSEGRIEKIITFLGRLPSITGVVLHGDGRGRAIGFPTANIDVFEEFVTPNDGVYLGYVNILDKKFKNDGLPSMMNIGSNPTFKGKRKWIESHIINFNEEIYGCSIKVSFLKKLRDEISFKNQKELISQIKKDINYAQNYDFDNIVT